MAGYDIFELTVGSGTAALAPIPGRKGAYEADMSTLLRWDPDLVISMTGTPEMDRVGAGTLGHDLAQASVCWRHVPIADFGVPNSGVDMTWASVEEQALQILANGGRVLTHCYGGCGRSGMAVLRLMVASGETPRAALTRLREVRPCAVETDAQFAWASNQDG